jgi:hypothetical protein
MKKGEATRNRIVVRTANLLNTQGYLGTPVSEIMRATGLQKGCIYRHSRAAPRFAFGRMRERLFRAIEGARTAKDKLLALFEVMRNAPRDEDPS